MAYDIETIEDAIISAIEAITAVSIRTVKTYQGQLDEKDIKELTAPLPAVYVVYGGSRFTPHGDRKVENIIFDLLVCDKNLRSEEEARRGGTGNPGTYAMLQAVRDAICGSQVGLAELSPLNIQSQTPVWFDGGVSIYDAAYTTSQTHLYTGP